MFSYAQLNEKNIVVGISELTREVIADNMIKINGLEVELGSTYEKTTNTFVPPVQLPVRPQETLEGKVTLLEEKIEQFNLINTDISLTVYEEILALREEVASLKGTSGNA